MPTVTQVNYLPLNQNVSPPTAMPGVTATILNANLSAATLYTNRFGGATTGTNTVTIDVTTGNLTFCVDPKGTDGTGLYWVRIAGQVDVAIQVGAADADFPHVVVDVEQYRYDAAGASRSDNATILAAMNALPLWGGGVATENGNQVRNGALFFSRPLYLVDPILLSPAVEYFGGAGQDQTIIRLKPGVATNPAAETFMVTVDRTMYSGSPSGPFTQGVKFRNLSLDANGANNAGSSVIQCYGGIVWSFDNVMGYMGGLRGFVFGSAAAGGDGAQLHITSLSCYAPTAMGAHGPAVEFHAVQTGFVGMLSVGGVNYTGASLDGAGEPNPGVLFDSCNNLAVGSIFVENCWRGVTIVDTVGLTVGGVDVRKYAGSPMPVAVKIRGGGARNSLGSITAENCTSLLNDASTVDGGVSYRDVTLPGAPGAGVVAAAMYTQDATLNRLAVQGSSIAEMVVNCMAATVACPAGQVLPASGATVFTLTLSAVPAGFPAHGQVSVPTGAGVVPINYTGLGASTLTGCTGGGGQTVSAGNVTLNSQSRVALQRGGVTQWYLTAYQDGTLTLFDATVALALKVHPASAVGAGQTALSVLTDKTGPGFRFQRLGLGANGSGGTGLTAAVFPD